MAERRVKVEAAVGLHARPAALFVQEATRSPLEVTVAKPGKEPVNAKSILAIIGMDATHGEEITIAADGDGADELLSRLAELVKEPA